jgi:glycine/D-amino acid oxidase-like deaminating enzyme
VAVIGGGLTDVVAALQLTRRGPKADLFEQNTVVSAPRVETAAWRPPATTGMSIGIRAAVAKLGFDTAARLYGAYAEAIDLVQTLVMEERIDCDFARTGKLNLASKPAHYQGFEKTHELLNTAWDWRPSWSRRPSCAARSDRTSSTAEWSSRRAPVSTWAGTSGDSARRPSAPV